MLSEWLITVGLGLDVAGAILIFVFGLPPAVNRGGTGALLLEGHNPAEAKKARWYDRLSGGGILLLIIGFLLQIWGAWV